MEEKRPLLKLLKAVLHLDELICYICIVVLIISTLICVFARYIFNSPMGWGEELQLICIVQIVFFGGACVIRNGGLTRVDIILDLFNEKTRKIVDIIVDIISYAVYGFIFVNGIKLVQNQLKIGRDSVMLHIPLWLTYICIPIGCGLMVLNSILVKTIPKEFDETLGEKE